MLRALLRDKFMIHNMPNNCFLLARAISQVHAGSCVSILFSVHSQWGSMLA